MKIKIFDICAEQEFTINTKRIRSIIEMPDGTFSLEMGEMFFIVDRNTYDRIKEA